MNDTIHWELLVQVEQPCHSPPERGGVFSTEINKFPLSLPPVKTGRSKKEEYLHFKQVL